MTNMLHCEETVIDRSSYPHKFYFCRGAVLLLSEPVSRSAHRRA